MLNSLSGNIFKGEYKGRMAVYTASNIGQKKLLLMVSVHKPEETRPSKDTVGH